MSKSWIMLAGLLFLGSVGTSQGHPLDSADIVYVDGLPCNRACQSYLAWSRRLTLSVAQQSVPVESAPAESAPLNLAPEKPVLRPARRAARPATAVHRENAKPAARRVAKQATPSRPAEIAKLQPAGDAAGNSEPAPSNVAVAPLVDDSATTSSAKAAQEQVTAATAPAEQVTAADPAPAPQPEANNVEAADPGAAKIDAKPAESAATNNRDNRVALLIARPEIEAVSDLTGKDIAIEDRQSALGASIRTAIMAAGAAEVRLSEEPMRAIDRLLRGEVSAAVLTLVSPEAAERFPDIPGYRIFRIPLSLN